MSNPLMAQPVSSTTPFTGASLLEDAAGVKDSIESGDWASGVLGIADTALDVLGFVEDPFGTILAQGLGWLMEHVGPLKQALDALAGNPDVITAHSQTWQNVSQELTSISVDLADYVTADVAGWEGQGADAYRQQAGDIAKLLSAASQASAGTGSGVATAGQVVAAVRALVRDTISEVVARMVSWALQVVATLGIGLTWVVPQCVQLIAKTAEKIARLVKNLINAIKTLIGLLDKAGGLFDHATSALQAIEQGTAATSAAPSLLPGFSNYSIKARRPSSGGSGSLPPVGPPTTPSSTPAARSPVGSGSTSATGPDSRSPMAPEEIDAQGYFPQRPQQGPIGVHGGPPYSSAPEGPWATPVPEDAHNHVIFGDLKPGRKPPGFTGGHVPAVSIPPDTTFPAGHGTGIRPNGNPNIPPRPQPLPTPPNSGLIGGHDPADPGVPGVYNLPRPQTVDTDGKTYTKPGISTTYPDGMHPGLVQNSGNQAWNFGNPNGGFQPNGPKTNSLDPAGGRWQGQAQIPFTPVWNPASDPGLPPHGAADPDNKWAGRIMNVDGFYGGDGGPRTYWPDTDSQRPPQTSGSSSPRPPRR
ncbi:hypothetical protein [Amycolatopsis sp. NPDC051372]|uniref:WXG100 family type VII secretion target n=1 Tax=Amycolatopsis sp. NPDC051372 TaxID=3155669 RepID=UPI00344532AE